MFHRGRETHICENPGPDFIKLEYGLSLISEKKNQIVLRTTILQLHDFEPSSEACI